MLLRAAAEFGLRTQVSPRRAAVRTHLIATTLRASSLQTERRRAQTRGGQRRRRAPAVGEGRVRGRGTYEVRMLRRRSRGKATVALWQQQLS